MNNLYHRIIELFERGYEPAAIMQITGTSSLIVIYVLKRKFYDVISGELKRAE